MRVWKRTIDIKNCLTEDVSDEECQRVAKSVAAVLHNAFAGVNLEEEDYDLYEIVLDLDESVLDVEDLNNVLSDLYDWADDNDVWLGVL